jgi:hypothetical protein
MGFRLSAKPHKKKSDVISPTANVVFLVVVIGWEKEGRKLACGEQLGKLLLRGMAANY